MDINLNKLNQIFEQVINTKTICYADAKFLIDLDENYWFSLLYYANRIKIDFYGFSR